MPAERLNQRAAAVRRPSTSTWLVLRRVRGAIRDVIIDLRTGSSTRLQVFGIDLSADNGRALRIHSRFGHGFRTTEDRTDVFCHMRDFYRPGTARSVRWDDPAFGVAWPFDPVVLSERDAKYPDVDPDSYDISTWEA